MASAPVSVGRTNSDIRARAAEVMIILTKKLTEVAHAVTLKFISEPKTEEERLKFGAEGRPPPDFLLKALDYSILPAIKNADLGSVRYLYVPPVSMETSIALGMSEMTHRQKKLRFAMLKQFETDFHAWLTVEGYEYRLYFDRFFLFPKGGHAEVLARTPHHHQIPVARRLADPATVEVLGYSVPHVNVNTPGNSVALAPPYSVPHVNVNTPGNSLVLAPPFYPPTH